MAKNLPAHQLIEIVLDSLRAERSHDTQRGRDLIHPDFRKTSMVISNDIIFPILKGSAVDDALEAAYKVEGREFFVFTTSANEENQTVFIELIEVEPRGDTVAVWPYVLICELEGGLIKHTRHYGDPALIKNRLSVEEIEKIVGQKTTRI